VWQIVTVAVLGLRVKSTFMPLILRAGVILILACAAVILRSAAAADPAVTGTTTIGERTILLPALILLLVAALASLPMPTVVPPIVPVLAETLAAAVVVGGIGLGSLGAAGLLFLPYLTIPLFLAGLTAGPAAGLACAAIASATLLASIATIGGALGGPDEAWNRNGTVVAWLFVFFAVPVVGAWGRRLRNELAPESEPAYADAHRLLSELHVVARQLSLGLDPRTLATALAEDLGAVVPQAKATVLSRSPGGRFVPLAGDEPEESAESAVEDAWVGAHPVKRDLVDGAVTAVPVLMGERVVALVVIATAARMDDGTLRQCRSVIDQSGPRLASAMLFEDVRRLATSDERLRLAREIHDGIAQDLASVGYALDDIRRDSVPEVAERVTTLREQMQAMVTDLRMSIFDLRAGVNDTVSLGTSLSEHAQRIGTQSGLVVTATVDESPQRRLPIAVEVELLRIVQEAITNVRRHARASNLWLTVTVEPPRAHITVMDDGRGLGKGRADSFGITGMRERAVRIGAKLHVGPGSGGHGTLVEIALGTDYPAGVDLREPPRPAVTRDDLTDPHGLTLVHASGRPSAPNPDENRVARTHAHGGSPRTEQEVTN
jgi:signal transduction histidine kinase